jgi:hypothetical protein
VILSTFRDAGPPSTAYNLVATTTVTTCNFSYIVTNADITDPETSLVIDRYNVAHYSVPSNIRYTDTANPPVYTQFSEIITPATSASFSSLYPESLYTLSVFATNDADIPCPVSISTTILTKPFTEVANNFSLTYPNRYYTNGTIKNVATGAIATRLVNTNTPWTSYNMVQRIHNTANRGTTSTQIMSLKASLLNNITSTIGPTISFGGFPAKTPLSSTNNNLLITPSAVTDMQSLPGFTGFYLQSRNTLTMNTPIFQPSKYDYIASISQTGTYSTSSSWTFQYDTPVTTPPNIISCKFNFNGTVPYVYITGVIVLYGSPTFAVSTVVSNLGNYYYSVPIIRYTNPITGGNWTPSEENNLNNMSPAPVDGALNFTETFNNTLTIPSLNTTYSSTLTLSVTANNIFSSASAPAPSIDCIIDGPSWNLVYNTMPQTYPTVGFNGGTMASYIIGCRCVSDSGIPTFKVLSSSPSSLPPIYDNTISLTVSTYELQVSKGYFVTPAAAPVLSQFAYINYLNKYYNATSKNTVDYSGITQTGYRYATFVWRVGQGADYTKLFFSINGWYGLMINGSKLLTTTDNTAVQIYYKLLDYNPVPIGATNMSSVWIDGNTTPDNGTSVTSGTYNTPVYLRGNNTLGTGNIIGENIPKIPKTPGPNTYIIFRIGLPMNKPAGFTSISAFLST